MNKIFMANDWQKKEETRQSDVCVEWLEDRKILGGFHSLYKGGHSLLYVFPNSFFSRYEFATALTFLKSR